MWTSGNSFVGYKLVLTGGCWVPTRELNPLEQILGDIEKALAAEFHYLAIAVSLTVPDICAALECDPAQRREIGKTYIAWCKTNLEPNYKHFTAEDCYRLRCGVIHEGKFGHPKTPYDNVYFGVPNTREFVNHDGLITWNGKTGLQLDARMFCETMIAAARGWLVSSATNPNVSTNMPHLVHLRPEGLPPFVNGVPVIA
jgi:hypothetical protein